MSNPESLSIKIKQKQAPLVAALLLVVVCGILLLFQTIVFPAEERVEKLEAFAQTPAGQSAIAKVRSLRPGDLIIVGVRDQGGTVAKYVNISITPKGVKEMYWCTERGCNEYITSFDNEYRGRMAEGGSRLQEVIRYEEDPQRYALIAHRILSVVR